MDAEAKAAADSGQSINNKVDYLQVTANLTHEYKELDDIFLNTLNSNAGKWFIDNFKHFNIGFFRGSDLNRKDACLIIRLIAGYALTGYYRFRMGRRDSPTCECGAPIQDLNHLFFECLNLTQHRRKLYSNLLRLEVPTPLSIITVLNNIDVKTCETLIKFIEDTKLKL